MEHVADQRAFGLVADRLQRQFPRLPKSVIADTVTFIGESFYAARIRDYVPLLVERQSRELLEHIGG